MNPKLSVLSNGRKLSYAEYGAPDGRPVLLLHGLVGSVISEDMEEQLASIPMRILAMARPGYGASDYFEMDCVADWPRQMAETAKCLPQAKVISLEGEGHVSPAVTASLMARTASGVITPAEVKRGGSMNELFSVLGIAGGILCAIGDLFLDLKGKGNRKLGASGIIDSNWVNMAYWRFGISILFAFAGAALLGFGFFSLAAQIADGHRELALATGICGYVSAIAAFFVHSVLCIQAIIYKKNYGD